MRFTFTDTATDQTLFSGDLTCRQCTFVKGDGHRCQRRTCKTLPYCWQHTTTQLGVKVGPSTIPGAGSGLFATKKFDSKSKWIAPLNGQKVSQATTDARYGPHNTAPYTVELKGQLYDGALKRYVGHYANSLFKASGYSKLTGTNAVIGNHNDVPWLKLQTMKKIAPGREILAYYGNLYKLEPQYRSKTA